MEPIGIIIIALVIIVLAGTIFWQVSLMFATIVGAPTVYSSDKAVKDALGLLNLKKGSTVVDLGCGNAKSLIMAAKLFGANGVGVERSPYAYLNSKFRVYLSGQRKKVKIVFGDFKAVEADLKKCDGIYLYLLNSDLKRMEEWLFNLIDKKTKVVVLAFHFAVKKPVKECETYTLGKWTKARLYLK